MGAAFNDFQHILHSSFKSGDIVICLSEYEDHICKCLLEENCTVFETTEIFEYPHSYGRWFLDIILHTSAKANDAISDYIFNKLKDRLSLKSTDNGFNSSIICKSISDDNDLDQIASFVRKYVDEIKTVYKIDTNSDEVTGAIVMNCNPFTNGHLYLIEQAVKQVGKLIIFVVEEDKSEFTFQDRIMLVREGTKEIKNVKVVPSGRFIISAETFPQYFDKNNLQKVDIDTSKDVRIFGSLIAPMLNITIRFVGEEPFDKVTEAYNTSMKIHLKEYGIKLIEIPRKQFGGECISASNVRRLLKAGRMHDVKNIVPSSTYMYLSNINKKVTE